MNRLSLFIVLLLIAFNLSCKKDNWISLFDGKTFNGWQASENKDSWQIVDGAFLTKGHVLICFTWEKCKITILKILSLKLR